MFRVEFRDTADEIRIRLDVTAHTREEAIQVAEARLKANVRADSEWARRKWVYETTPTNWSHVLAGHHGGEEGARQESADRARRLLEQASGLIREALENPDQRAALGDDLRQALLRFTEQVAPRYEDIPGAIKGRPDKKRGA